VTEGPTPLVDYTTAAERYDAGRSMGDAALDAWWSALRPYLPGQPVRTVVDVGAGTGQFAAAWCRWLRASGGSGPLVVAVEPSAAMRERAVTRARQGPRFAVAAGAAERLPLAADSADVVWVSAVLHHVDVDAAARSIGLVLRPGGRALVRGFVPDRSTVPWLAYLPGAERASVRFPNSARIASAFGAAGLEEVGAVEVAEPQRHRARDAAEWITRMRSADSILTALTDAEITSGVTALVGAGDELLPPLALTLLAFARQSDR
jgi:SAM-dependent methyltransferase